MEAPQREQPRGGIRVQPHTQAQGRLPSGMAFGMPSPSPWPPPLQLCSLFLPGCARKITLVLSYPISLVDLGHQLMV